MTLIVHGDEAPDYGTPVFRDGRGGRQADVAVGGSLADASTA